MALAPTYAEIENIITESHNNINVVCYGSKLPELLKAAPVGTTYKYRTNNKWHECYNEYEKISKTKWENRFSVDGKPTSKKYLDEKEIVSHIFNSAHSGD